MSDLATRPPVRHAAWTLSGAARRVGAMLLRHLYILRSSWPRILEIAYWPTVQMIIWGFLSTFLHGQSSYVAQAFGVLLAGVMLWDVLFRGQLGFAISFLEEMWSRNLANIYVSPLRPFEHVAALIAMSILRAIIGLAPASVLAIFLFHFSIYDLGLPLLAFFFNLMMLSWAVGLLSVALLMRYGLGAESLIWFLIFLLAPICAVYYPVTVLPDWLEPIAMAVPATSVFEGMRIVLFEQRFDMHLFWRAFLLNIVYLAAGAVIFVAALNDARRRGRLFQVGE
ncbi:MAG: ABC transporter permease [Dongiaceae bacterium]